MIEVEYKYAASSLESIRRELDLLGATLMQQRSQEDEYYNHHLDDFKQKDIAFRIRQSDGQYELTFKGPNLDPVGKIREEINLPVADATDRDKLIRILDGVGFYRVAAVAKTRQAYRLLWNGLEVEICLDQVADLGDFVELELIVDQEDSIDTAKAAIEDLATRLKVSQPIRTSYLDLLMQQDLE